MHKFNVLQLENNKRKTLQAHWVNTRPCNPVIHYHTHTYRLKPSLAGTVRAQLVASTLGKPSSNLLSGIISMIRLAIAMIGSHWPLGVDLPNGLAITWPPVQQLADKTRASTEQPKWLHLQPALTTLSSLEVSFNFEKYLCRASWSTASPSTWSRPTPSSATSESRPPSSSSRPTTTSSRTGWWPGIQLPRPPSVTPLSYLSTSVAFMSLSVVCDHRM